MVHSPSLALALAVPTKNVLICKVVKVTDGDTITVLTDNNEQERIRLWGIDAPEQRGAQPYWKTSRDQLAVMDALETVPSIGPHTMGQIPRENTRVPERRM